MRLVNELVGGWRIVIGTGSWLEAHLVTRLSVVTQLPTVYGCGVTPEEVRDLVQQAWQELGQLPLLVLVDSLAADQGRALMRQLRRRHRGLQILLFVQNERWLSAEALAQCQAQAIVHVHSFGNGTAIRALQALRRGQSYLDPSLRDWLERTDAMHLSGREWQVLEGLSRGLTNKQIALELEIASTTVREYVSHLCGKLRASNRTQAISRAIELGLLSDLPRAPLAGSD